MDTLKNFCNPAHEVETWYAVLTSKEVKAGQAQAIEIGQNRLLVRRFVNGQIVASSRFCPHMGTDLLLANELPGSRITCAFHGLSFNAEGVCLSQSLSGNPAYQLTVFPTKERYGLIWVYLGKTPKFDIPELGINSGWSYHYPSKELRSHHHIVICNGLDFVHTRLVHGFSMDSHILKKLSPQILEAHIKGSYRYWWMKLLSNTRRTPLSFSFTSYGPSISVADVDWHGTRLVIVFTARQTAQGTSRTNTLLHVDSKNPIDWLRGWAVVSGVLWQDVSILDSIMVKENFTPNDEGVIAFRDLVNEMPIFDK